jgi:hypothetical protein
LQLISATDTNIKIKTVPLKNVNVIVLSSNMEVYDRFNQNADEYGDVSFVFSSDATRFDLTIFVKDIAVDQKVAYEKLENQIAGEDIYVEVIPKDFTIVEIPEEENVPTENTENLTEEPENFNLDEIAPPEKSEKKSLLSGLAIFGENNKIGRIILYVLGGIVLTLIIFFIIRKIRRGEKTEKEIKVKKMSELMEERKIEERKDTPESYYKVLDETQKKLEATQKELNQIKNQERIKEVERKLQQDQQELRKLKGF